MSERFLRPRRRFALWRAHGGVCAYCGEPVSFAELSIDHVVPGRLGGNPAELRRAIDEYGLAADFAVDSPENLLPAHQRCNREKSDRLLAPAAIHFYLTVARRKVAQVVAEEARLDRTLAADDLMGRLHIAVTEGLVDRNELLAALEPPATPSAGGYDPLVFTFGVSMEDLFETESLPPEAPIDYPHLCDWLEQDLIKRFARVGCSVFMPEASERTGETLSVRVAIVRADAHRLEAFEPGWWEALEAKYYSELYGEFFEPSGLTTG